MKSAKLRYGRYSARELLRKFAVFGTRLKLYSSAREYRVAATAATTTITISVAAATATIPEAKLPRQTFREPANEFRATELLSL